MFPRRCGGLLAAAGTARAPVVRPHLIITLISPAGQPRRPHWIDAIGDKGGADIALSPGIARALAVHDTQVWTTEEYAPATAQWSPEERDAGLNRIYRLILRNRSTIPPALSDDIRLVPGVAAAREGAIGVAQLPVSRQAGIDARVPDEWSRQAIDLARAHRVTRGHPDVVVAILDTGVALSHPEYERQLMHGRDFVDIIDGANEFVGDFIGADPSPDDEVGHGTHVTGIVAAQGQRMAKGIAPSCRIMPVRVLGAMVQNGQRVGAGLVENINAGIKYAVDSGASVINMSLGVRHESGGLPHEEMIRYALAKNVSIIAAAGNDGHESLYFPGALPGVIAVGSSGRDDQVSQFSTFGPHVSLTAPGEDIYSAHPEGYAYASGTSHAAPFVAGAAALLQSRAAQAGTRLSPADIRRCLVETADRPGPAIRDRRGGFGRLNIPDALGLCAGGLN